MIREKLPFIKLVEHSLESSRKILSLLPLLLLLAACANAGVLSLNADVETTVTATSLGDMTAEGELVGKTPITIAVNDYRGKILVLNASGRVPQYWIIPDAISGKVVANVKMVEDSRLANQGASGQNGAAARGEGGGEASVPMALLNSYTRLVLRAYQQLRAGDNEAARASASRLTQLAPRAAASDLLTGLSYLQDGKNDEARASFERAKALDPEDQSLDVLIKRVR